MYSLSEPQYAEVLRDKIKMYRAYEKYLGRNLLYVPEVDFQMFQVFCRANPNLLAKPRFGGCGQGIIPVDILKCSNLFDLYNDLKENDYILEELLVQHSDMALLHPFSVNTIRVTTVVVNHNVRIMNVALRIGNNYSIVDNHSAGGIVANADPVTGVVYTTGVDKFQNRYMFHPVTKEQIVGFQIPFWDKIREFVHQVALVIPEIKYAGWDIAVSQNGIVLIEGNDRGMMDVQQQADQTGKWWLYQEIINEIAD